jgi:RHS repeat-associated protein
LYYSGCIKSKQHQQLIAYGECQFEYDGFGERIKLTAPDEKSETGIHTVEYLYDSNGRLIKQSNGLEFFYDHTGVMGLKYEEKYYFYRKDSQQNIVAILDNTGKAVVRYTYDSWGNHDITVLDSSCEQLANLNPFRYRGYYYDTETDLYFLKTRYYDPEIGCFISIDGISYLNPNAINGLNLYAYCSNNPVMSVDYDGTEAILITNYNLHSGGLPIVGHSAFF